MVADNGTKIPSPFDVRTIKDLVGLMSRHDLTEIDLREGEVRIRLRRGPKEVQNLGPPVVAVATPAVAPPSGPTATPPPPAKTDNDSKATKNLQTIKSPTPGTFYTSSSPDTEPFVHVGSRVTPTTVVCLIEAMKIFNEITADCTGVITEILVDNQQPVEYGQVLFKVDPLA
ncbi:MAG TPA: acetyl-CoA carboxylase biotin carboxyl carrier protein [Gemmataceae bacterium]|jgi:acetyl-CoA carboxylase biotin carboxyl carrier protein|nr:acetyl-CoA carboxylase biotin carboxyl carrier protein [Gemmataceae bacterium]